MRKKIAILSAVILGILLLLAAAYLAGRHIATKRLTEKLQSKLPSFDITVSDTGITGRPDCLRSVRLTRPGAELTAEDVCLESGMLSVLGKSIEASSRLITAKIDADTYRNARADKHATISSDSGSTASAKLRAERVEMSLTAGGRHAVLSAEKTEVGYASGEISGSAKITVNETAGLPFDMSGLKPFELSLEGNIREKRAALGITPETPYASSLSIKDVRTAFSFAMLRIAYAPDNLSAALSDATVAFPDHPETARLGIHTLTLEIAPNEPNIVRRIDISGPHLDVSLKALMQNPKIADNPVLKDLLGFWKQDAGAYLGSAPNKSVRRADVKRPKPPVRKNPISREKISSFKSFLNEMQQKLQQLPAIEISNGTIDVDNGGQHLILRDLDFSTSEIVRDAQDMQIKFRAREAMATLDLSFDAESSYPSLGLTLSALPSDAFLRILNLPVPENSSGTIDLRATLALKDDSVTLESTAGMHGFAFYVPEVSPNIVHDINLDIRLGAEYAFSSDKLEIGSLSITSGPVTADGHIRIRDVRSNPVIEFELGARDVPCADIAKAIPPGLLPTITDIALAGTSVSPKITGTIPWKDPLTAKLKETGFDDSCLPVRVLPHMPERLNAPDFIHTTDYTYFTDSISVGPGTSSYTRLASIPPYVKAAMFLTEDKRFFDHGPLRIAFIERALRLNLNQRRYVYGGSTIAQQLTKNLFLNRNKNLARKLEEAFIAWRMVTVVPKSRIFELYVNVIEFGPDIYGIRHGAEFYFGKRPEALEPLEGAFLASLKVAPSKGGRLYKNGFPGGGGWWKKRQRYILKVLAENGYISVADVIGAYDWVPKFDYPKHPGDSRHAWLRQYGEYLKKSDKSPHISDEDSERKENEASRLKIED
ncbi:MAG: transglycosylase domain-containing protein [Proteobacteria bacterium]|nr:transglycosylase domain-containing protein [Pseudomonadota bacterium]